ncbi:class I SAM-dependent methyltransferase [Actinokineospora sp. HUAS TT18]|uniref:class I SAM-dependent methyltransferase n=1 Tax=Actinokineospora sp. HUAS TT18 TaxID=3447451 RepID=UPI003F51B189
MAETAYVFAPAFDQEDERLRLGEALWDRGTKATLAEIGVGPGARCLEVGAGRGSIAAWLAGRGAEVTAVDLDVSRLAELRGVDVRKLDIARDRLPGGFDVVHGRLVMQHVANRPAAVTALCRALRPGGHLMLEDTDPASLFSHVDGPFHPAVKHAAYTVMAEAGAHPRSGLLDLELVEAAGLVDVRAEGRVEVVRGGSDGGRWFALWVERLRPAMLARGLVSEVDIDRAVVDLMDPRHRWLSQVMVTVVGRKAG